jgi:hypothetical protein
MVSLPEEFITSFNQKIMNVHEAGTCLNEYCCIHNWSDHHMKGWPQNWRSDRKLMERICSHGVGHPDPDEVHLDLDFRGLHGCDGCCTPIDKEVEHGN